MRMSRQAPRQDEACASHYFSETKSMFKKLVPVIALALIAGPVFAADTPASSGDQSSSSSTAKSSHHKKHGKKSTGKSDSSKDSSANTPAK
jgi:hypothetical protein